MAQRVFLIGNLVTQLDEDGQEYKALQLEDGSILTKKQQHFAEMAEVGEVPGRGKVFDWLDTTERSEALKSNSSLAGKQYEDLPPEISEYVLEVNVPALDEEGNPTIKREKVAKAKADGLDTDKMEKIKPHEWQVK